MTERPRRRVLLLHLGGTLGMEGTPLVPAAYSQRLGERVPELGQIAELETRILYNLDSSDVGPVECATLARAIDAGRAGADGFVVVHGTDTMAFTAAALAFALPGLDRPVVLTGAQRPLVALRSDARRNLADAVELATHDIPEVGICFDGLLLRGTRAVKADARTYHAFESPGVEPLARLGLDVDVGAHVRRPAVPFRCDPRFDDRVAVVYVTPGLDPAWIEGLLAAPAPPRGIVLAALGVGTVPSGTRPLAPVVRAAVDTGVDVVVVTQRGGTVELALYENSRVLADAGAISGGAMRIEAAVPKLMHALAAFDDRAERRRWLETDAAGERS
ncbi:MAG TPA: asparaginase domain-containing protein [Haliangiales bacterium]|nr:asparaginase domain-containing protein [Haliangiales bacterium]